MGVSAARNLYDELTDDLLYDPAVGRSTMMGYPCVRRAGRFFASFDTQAEALVVKLPRERVAELVADGTGEPFAPNGRVFREWVTVLEPDPDVWERLLAEARDFATPAPVRRPDTTRSLPTGFARSCRTWASMACVSRGCSAASLSSLAAT